jgi:hypothetical protein
MRADEDKDPVIEAYARHLDLSLIRKNLKLSVEERILAAQELLRLTEELRRAGEAAQKKS